ncbi:YhgE/Pip family protein [Methanobrevibacter sp.]|uniref:YhgE/Pip family protein n=1 Tax=Methanobrevibacter sp. TaxID=66852 RepID=UPI003870CCFA
MSGRDIGNIIEIIRDDFKSAFSNPIVSLVLIGIIIVPSLYALINIQACWDPYEKTDDLDFAIANLDNGTDFEGNQLNIGNELAKELKKNDKFDWTFVTEDELRDGVYSGEYYAGIILPKNLSENVVSIMGDDPKQAKLEYIVNVKANPVAAKLTDSAANSVYTSLNAKIVEIINIAAYGKLGELQEGLSSGASQLASGGSQIQAGSAQISSGAGQVSSGASQVKDGASQVQEGASQVQEGASDVNDGASQIKQGSSVVKQSASEVEQGSKQLQSAIDPSTMPEGPMKDYAEGNIKLANASGEVAKGSSELADGSVDLAEGSSRLANGSSDVAKGASDLASGSVDLAEGSLSLAAGAQLLGNSASQALYSAAAALGSSANSLSGITGINETILGDYFLAPVKLDKHELFPVPNYGSQVAPFYLVLSMWVGALISCAMLKTGISKGTKYSPLEMYFGKLALFVVLSILQVGVTLIGAFILGIYVDNVPLFILSALIVSVVFMVFIYSLASALGNVGKAIAIVLLVIQISGTGGIYPVQIMDPIFRVLNPYLPMTYAITLIREAQLGLVWSNYLPALVILLAMGILTVIVAIIVKEKADHTAHYFEECLEESGLF